MKILLVFTLYLISELHELINTFDSQKGRCSISDNKRSRVVSVRISDVREDDEGVYYCGVGEGGESVSYISHFSKIHLQVSDSKETLGPRATIQTTSVTYRRTSAAPTSPAVTISTEETSNSKESLRPRATIQSTSVTYRRTSAAPTAPTVAIPAEEPSTPGSSTIIIISVSICVVLLLIGGLTLIFYKLRCSKTQDSAFISQPSGTNEQSDYENDPPGNLNIIRMDPNYQNMQPNTNNSDSVYQSLDPRTREPDSVYQSLNPNTNQSDSVYQSINPTPTNQIQSTRA
ncbi:polymeric immunoglobulin receptor-like [Astyanax mexicanus]|uniref:polymeric immunoglobulin receptor-like n=1 Tax=Astyanax mexicanus TaxID=7994 RepID=UPI0020CAEC54|nr:polymeric immunoglobulin receptor-like [Astyanax mexicanus]